MKYWNGKEIVARYLGSRPLQMALKGTRVVWQAVRSCFGSGVWIGWKPWIGTDKWKGTK